jgi:hypothetical protein
MYNIYNIYIFNIYVYIYIYQCPAAVQFCPLEQRWVMDGAVPCFGMEREDNSEDAWG